MANEMGAGLAAVGEISYNGIRFGAAEQLKCDSQPVLDESGRTTLYVKHTFTISGLIQYDFAALGIGVDWLMAGIHKKLSQPGGVLIVKQKGFGASVEINNGAVRDVKWGPRTTIYKFEPVAANRAISVVMQIETCIPECPLGTPRNTGVMSINYQVDIGIDIHGDTHRKITGHLIIAQTRKGGGKQIIDDADQYLGIIAPKRLRGFTRTRDRTLSLDKCRLDFCIIDVQIPSRNPYPPHVTEISAQHRVSWNRSRGELNRWYNTLSMTVSPSSRVKGIHALYVFLTILKARREAAGGYTHILNFEMVEDIFGRGSSFRATWRTLVDLRDKDNSYVMKSGIYREVGTTWKDWEESMESIQSATGTAGIVHKPQEDAIIDLCGPFFPTSTGSSQLPSEGYTAASSGLATAISNKPPGKDYLSWLLFRNQFFLYEDPPVTTHRLVQAGSPPEGVDVAKSQSAHPDFGKTKGEPDVVQTGGNASYKVRWTGRARRVGAPIPKPKLTKIGTQPCTEISARFVVGEGQNVHGVIVYETTWDIFYSLPGPPGVLKPLDNPNEGIFDGNPPPPPII